MRMMFRVGLDLIDNWDLLGLVGARVFRLETSVFRVADVAVGGGFGVRCDEDVFGFVLFGFFYVRRLDGQVSRLFTFSFVLFTARVNFANQVPVEGKALHPLLLFIFLVLGNGHIQHSILDFFI